MAREIQVVEDEVGAAPTFDTAVSRALLDAVSAGERPESLRIWRPRDALAFSIADRRRPGFARAVAGATRAGFAPFLRLAGGHAAVYTRETLAFGWAIPSPRPREGIDARFEALSARVRAALRRLGVDARVGEVPGEYCPGAHSVNARGVKKLMGVGQRVVGGAAHVGGVIVVGASERARAALEPVYLDLELELAPETVGSVEDEVPGVGYREVRDALLAELSESHALQRGALEPALLAAARRLEARYRVDAAATATADGAKLAAEA